MRVNKAMSMDGWRSLEGLEITGVSLSVKGPGGEEHALDISDKAVAAVLLWNAGRHFQPEMVMFLRDLAETAERRGRTGGGAEIVATIADAIDELLPPWKEAGLEVMA